ncbi:hypothetical protein ACVW0B_002877 [Thermostichus sp. MS-CIW-23]
MTTVTTGDGVGNGDPPQDCSDPELLDAVAAAGIHPLVVAPSRATTPAAHRSSSLLHYLRHLRHFVTQKPETLVWSGFELVTKVSSPVRHPFVTL